MVPGQVGDVAHAGAGQQHAVGAVASTWLGLGLGLGLGWGEGRGLGFGTGLGLG